MEIAVKHVSKGAGGKIMVVAEQLRKKGKSLEVTSRVTGLSE